ncbi:hypothetical protein P152DRAFT_468220 [Eremomyces bilateralis CBS 781.70]|uniref:SIS domain-containing protein n=1 Tax=Eremomyces bilateralis CBS 781.70 TaxID=1392243 RepID=A0A6G1FV60_9PEZI|nr:uncharacterized protein P152DRAFT_468220 [Eremomyces bilateralis CBS 781.70]KAF1809785.1 hypothetical protein P152DRAFT_468220 [Eremomyces bilateralis CBS 781.70]
MNLKRKRSNSCIPSLAPSGTLTPEEDQDVLIPAAKKLHTPSSTSTQASYILNNTANALLSLTSLYDTSTSAQGSLRRAVQLLAQTQLTGHKIITCGVGKSGFVAQKLSAMLKSLGIASSYMSAAEATHGDLGDVRGPHSPAFGRHVREPGWSLDGNVRRGADSIVFISYSGRTEELLRVRDRLPRGVGLVAISGVQSAAQCALLASPETSTKDEGDGHDCVPLGEGERVLLPAPIPESEEATYGVATPTTSALVAMAVSDMLALCIAEELFEGDRDRMKEVFKRNHPGGAIGEKSSKK